MKNLILLDTNFIISCLDFKIEFEQIKQFNEDIAILDSCFEEIKRFSKQQNKVGKLSKLAIILLNKNKIKLLKGYGRCDNAIKNYAKKTKCIVATNDKALIKNLKTFGTKIIRIRQKKYLVIE